MFFEHYKSIISLFACIFLTCMYVASLYVWRSSLRRDHPSTIKRRFFSVLCMMFVAPFYVQYFFTEETLSKGDFYELLGLRWPGLKKAVFAPLFLTAVLFLGPLTMQVLSGIWKLYVAPGRGAQDSAGARGKTRDNAECTTGPESGQTLEDTDIVDDPRYWYNSWKDLVWVRNHIMAPLSEEWVFRSCMVPLLLQCLDPVTAVFFGPLLFGIAHFHHMFEQMKTGYNVKAALMVSTFQFTYTTLFGAYSSYLFLRTGHFVAPLVAHMFCNHMGFPNFFEIRDFPRKQRIIIICNFLLGFGLWCVLLTPVTSPDIYDNRLPVVI